jgi:N-acetylmuramoyl-L-alanine amidase
MRHPAALLSRVSAIAAVAALAASLGPSSPALAAPPADQPHPYVVAIDAGHGGVPDDHHPELLWDPGTIAVNGLMEKDLTLNVARRVRALLEADRVKVVMTREQDTYVDISPRMDLAIRAGAGLFVSIHFNGFTDPAVSGSVVLYPNDQSLPFAQVMSDTLGHRLSAFGIPDNGTLGKPDLWVHATMPAVTVEGGYLTNAHDAATFARSDALDALARGVRAGIEAQAPAIATRKAELIAWQNAHAPAPRPVAAQIQQRIPAVWPAIPAVLVLGLLAAAAGPRRLGQVGIGLAALVALVPALALRRSEPRRGRARRYSAVRRRPQYDFAVPRTRTTRKATGRIGR